MMSIRKQKVYDLLKGIETGDPESVKVVNEQKYIQHNPQTHEGHEGLADLFSRLAKTNPRVEIVRLLEDGDFVFGHTIYEFSSTRIGFEVFRYENDQVIEHWDNIQSRVGDMVGGYTEIEDVELTETNREIVKRFITGALIGKDQKVYESLVESQDFIDHSTLINLSGKMRELDYQINHRLLCEGNFVLAVNEGNFADIHSSFYDLFRLKNNKIVEHWDTTEKIPPRELWKNSNGKF